jgi:dolichyl-phosphate beta-glucosyltransferase
MQKTCIVIPFFNEENRFPVLEFITFFDENSDYFFCLVNDGSKDGTSKMLADIHSTRKDRILIPDFEINVGKAEAVRVGILKALEWKPFNFVAYFDADLSTPLSELRAFLAHGHNYSFIVGSRIKHLGSIIERSKVRHYIGRILATMASLILNLPVYDTQCGAKLINSKLVPVIFKDPFISRWLFDIEIFARLISEYGYEEVDKMIKEVPLTIWIEKGDSRIKPGYVFKIPFELYKIYSLYKLKRRVSSVA